MLNVEWRMLNVELKACQCHCWSFINIQHSTFSFNIASVGDAQASAHQFHSSPLHSSLFRSSGMIRVLITDDHAIVRD